MRYILGMILLLLTVSPAFAGEVEVAKAFCDKLGGLAEIRLVDNTRCDCLTKNYAYEVDYASKWAESIGQAVHYARLTKSQAGIAIIVKDVKDFRYAQRLVNTIIEIGYKLELRFILVDEQGRYVTTF